jgi:hypothetical protein
LVKDGKENKMEGQLIEDSQLNWFKLPKHEWTQSYWKFIDIVTSNYRPSEMSEEAKRTFCDTLLGMRYLLPCPKCRAHFEKHILINPIEHYMHKDEGLIEWMKPVKDQTTQHKRKIEATVQIPIQSKRQRINIRAPKQDEPNNMMNNNNVSFFQMPPEQHKKRGKYVKVPQVTEEIISSVIEGPDGKKMTLKRNRVKEMTFKEYIQYRIETTPHVSACNCG